MHRSVGVDLHAKASYVRASTAVSIESDRMPVVSCGDYQSLGGICVLHSILYGGLVGHAVLESGYEAEVMSAG